MKTKNKDGVHDKIWSKKSIPIANNVYTRFEILHLCC